MSTDHKIYLGRTGDGRHIAAAASSPYFCVTADSEEAVLKKISDVLRFYSAHAAESQAFTSKAVNQVVTELVPSRTVHWDDLAVA